MKDPEKSLADSAVRIRESYKKDLKSHDDSATRNCENYLRTLRKVVHETMKVT